MYGLQQSSFLFQIIGQTYFHQSQQFFCVLFNKLINLFTFFFMNRLLWMKTLSLDIARDISLLKITFLYKIDNS